MIVADIPENLPVPRISKSYADVPEWNKCGKMYMESIFEFADGFLHDDGALVLLHCDDRKLQKKVDKLADRYDMVLAKDWWGFNAVPLSSPRDPTRTVCDLSTNV